MQFHFFDQNDVLLFSRSDAISATRTAETMTHAATFPDIDERVFERGLRVGFIDDTGKFDLYEIRQPARSQPKAAQGYEAEHVVIAELSDYNIDDRRPYNTTPATAVSVALEGTTWQLGRVDVDGIASTNYYDISPWEALLKVRDTWGVAIVPRITYSGNQITGRYIDVLSRHGEDRGLRLTLDSNIQQVGISWDDRTLKTALKGRGKGEVVGENSQGDDTYGRKITFEDVVWVKANGDPADKPLGQNWVEDVEATATYGRKGEKRLGVADFPDCEDPDELLTLTWNALQEAKIPQVTIKATIVDLFKLGYSGQPIVFGDTVTCLIDPWGIQSKLRVVKLTEDLLRPGNTKPTIGDYSADIVSYEVTNSYSSDLASKIAQNAPSLLQGYIDTSVLAIMSSKTKRTTMEDGSEVYETDDGTKAVWFSGAGILLASELNPDGSWRWRTAITGSGIVADEITVGILRAALVTILGSENMYWSGPTMYIMDKSNSQHQIRIGLYDGSNYGIAFTQDDGATWTQVIDYRGVQFSTVGLVTTDEFQGYQEQVSAEFSVIDGEINLKVDKSGVINSINVSSEGVSIQGQKLEISNGTSQHFTFGQAGSSVSIPFALFTGGLYGASATATGMSASNVDHAFWAGGGKFNVTQGGHLDASDATIAGVFKAGYFTFDDSGMHYLNQSDPNNEYIFEVFANPYGGGAIVYGANSSFGADFAHTTTLIGKDIIFETAISEGSTASFTRTTEGYEYQEICFVCTEAGNTYDTAKGNLGTQQKIWDVGWIDTIHYRSHPSDSSREYKDDIRPLPSQGRILDQLEVVSFYYRDEKDGRKRTGLIYEDAIKIVPDLCIETSEGGQKRFGIDYEGLVPMLLKEIQDLRICTESLKKTNAALEERLAAIEKKMEVK